MNGNLCDKCGFWKDSGECHCSGITVTELDMENDTDEGWDKIATVDLGNAEMNETRINNMMIDTVQTREDESKPKASVSLLLDGNGDYRHQPSYMNPNVAKRLFLDKCFGKWFDDMKNTPNYTYLKEISDRDVDFMRMAWAGCAEYFDVTKEGDK